MELTLAIVWGFALDALIGDPEWLWHPVCAIGGAITRTEKRLRRVFAPTKMGETIAGVLLWLVVTGLGLGVTAAVLFACGLVSHWLRFAGEIVLCYFILARKSLGDAGAHVERALGESLEEGRAAVGRYVGRDTGELSRKGVIKAAVETVAENTTDGVIAPLIFMLIGGAPLGMWYKAVNTLDSMVGYHNDKYEYMGKFSAKMDDIVNFIPARLSALLLIAAAAIAGFDAKNALRIWKRDRRKHKSPNAGQTESAVAGALGVQLAGDAAYFGKTVKKATLGDDSRPIERADIGHTVLMMNIASLLALGVGVVIRVLGFLIFQ